MNKIPLILEDYLNYMEVIKSVSPNTVKEYYYDLSNLLRFIKKRFRLVSDDVDLSDIDISDIDIDLIKKIKLTDLHAYISFADKVLKNGTSAKARKVASTRSFFEYLHLRVKLIDENPAQGLEFPKSEGRNPVYLTLSQANHLLNTVLENKNEMYRYRDYAIILLFLTCGLRLSELSSIDIDKIQDDSLSVIGKGNKERTIFLNDACIDAINKYLELRPNDSRDGKALFLSKRKQRISNRAIQHMIDRYLAKAGFDTSIYSTHKLRHTAATLMYKHGDVDIRALQEILGHESVSTTQIYTHLDDERLRDAIARNPLSNRKALNPE